jgi:hypothetical protein
MGFWGKLLGGAIGTVGGTLGLGPLAGGVLGTAGSQIGEKYLPFKRGGKIRMVGTMPMVRVQRKLRRGSAGMKRKMAMLRAMKR